MASLDNLTVTSTGDDPPIIVAEGQLDSHTSPSLERALGAVDATAAVSVDLAGVTFVDSSGLRVIVRAHQRQCQSGGSLTLVRLSAPVSRLLDITGLTSELRITQ